MLEERRSNVPHRAGRVLYLTAIERRKNRTNPTGRINGWKKILNTLTMHYGDRVAPTNYTITRLHTKSDAPYDSAAILRALLRSQ